MEKSRPANQHDDQPEIDDISPQAEAEFDRRFDEAQAQHAKRREWKLSGWDCGSIECGPAMNDGEIVHVREVLPGKAGLLALLEDAREMTYKLNGVTPVYNAVCSAISDAVTLPEGQTIGSDKSG